MTPWLPICEVMTITLKETQYTAFNLLLASGVRRCHEPVCQERLHAITSP